MHLKNLLLGFAVASILAFASLAPALAAPIPYSTVNIPADTPSAPSIALIANLNAGSPVYATTSTCTGTTTATCTGIRFVVSYSGLTTAAGVTATAQTVTNTSVAVASQIFCQTNGYSGTGNPLITNVIPAAGSFTYLIQNTHASAALNATVPTVCFVYN